MNRLAVFAFVGHMGTGKNYLAEKVLPSVDPDYANSFLVMALADHFKVDAVARDGCAFEEIFYEKTSESRTLLQKRGTEEGRARYGEDVWVRGLLTWLRVLAERSPTLRNVAIVDVRFENELRLLRETFKERLVVVKIEAPGRFRAKLEKEGKGDATVMAKIRNHPSELEIDGITDYDLLVRNDEGDDPDHVLREYFERRRETRDDTTTPSLQPRVL